jgi:hypothetical protein
LRSYDVPEGQKNQIARLLHSVLNPSEDQSVGRVVPGTGNNLLVIAPAGIHEGLADMMRGLENMDPAPPPPQVKMTYWFVLGRPLRPAEVSDRPVRVVGTAGLDEISPALDGIVEAQGPTEFQLVEQLQLVSSGAGRTSARGTVCSLEQQTSVSGGMVVAELMIAVGYHSPSRLTTEVALESGHLLVLGQTGVRSDQLSPHNPIRVDGGRAESRQTFTLYYIIEADF